MKFFLSTALIAIAVASIVAYSPSLPDEQPVNVPKGTLCFRTLHFHFNQLSTNDQQTICRTVQPTTTTPTTTQPPQVTLPRNSFEVERYVGCFKDTSERSLKKAVLLGEKTSVKSCVEACQKEGFVYAGAENGNECFCGNEYPDPTKWPLLNETVSCNVNCRAEPTVKCGGYWTSSVYETGNQVLVLKPDGTQVNVGAQPGELKKQKWWMPVPEPETSEEENRGRVD